MASSGAAKNPKKTNLLDHHSIKHLLDESVTEVVKSRGYTEDVRLSNLKLLIGSIIIAIALLAQFYPKKFPENKDFLIGCIGLYVVINALLQFIIYTKEKNAILFTYPPAGICPYEGEKISLPRRSWTGGTSPPSTTHHSTLGFVLDEGDEPCPGDFFHEGTISASFNSTGLVVSSKLPRFSDMYTLTIASADPKSISANKSVVLTKSVTKWFTEDGVLVEGLFWKDVEKLIDDYNGDRKSK